MTINLLLIFEDAKTTLSFHHLVNDQFFHHFQQMVHTLPGARAGCGRSAHFILTDARCPARCRIQDARCNLLPYASFAAGLVTRTWDKRSFKRLPRVAAKKCELKKLLLHTVLNFSKLKKTFSHNDDLIAMTREASGGGDRKPQPGLQYSRLRRPARCSPS